MVVVGPAELSEIGGAALGELLDRRELVVVIGDGHIGGAAAAALLFSDYAVLREGSTVEVDTAEAWAAAVWRLGRSALRLKLTGKTLLTAVDAHASGLCDEVTSDDAAAWIERWMRNRSESALDAAATLIRARGGDALERAAFARLFAIGDPQRGLGAFLAKTKPSF